MRIAFVTPEYITEKNFDGGLANYLYRTCLLLKAKGHEPLVVVVSDKNEHITHEGVEVYRVTIGSKIIKFINILTWHKVRSALCWVYASRRLNEQLKRIHNADLIDIVQYTNYTAPALFRPKKIPAVIRLSSFQPLWRFYSGYNKPTIDQRLQEYLELQAIKKADHVFCPSKKISSIIEAATKHKVEIIESPIFIDRGIFDYQPYQDFLSGKDYLLFFGSIYPLKGADLIAEIIAPLLKKYPNIYFAFAGKDLGHNGLPMMDIIWNNAGTNRGRVLYLGKMHHKYLYPIIERANLVVLPSKIENFPNVLLEAMALKKIVIGADVTSMEEIIEDGVSGFLCKHNDSVDLFNKIEAALNLDDEGRKKISENAYLEISEFTPEIIITKLLKFYEKIAQ